jgi:geranylgeranyl pyrophosphate synthase
MAQTNNWKLSENEYVSIISAKTAALFRCSCHLGAILANPEPNITKSLIKYGENVGIAFQITDDLLDIIGSKAETGKAPGSDLDTNKLTLPVIYLMRQADKKTRNQIKESMLNGKMKSETLLKFLKSFGGIDYSRRQTQKYVKKSLAALGDVKESREKTALIETARYIALRAE